MTSSNRQPKMGGAYGNFFSIARLYDVKNSRNCQVSDDVIITLWLSARRNRGGAYAKFGFLLQMLAKTLIVS